MDFLSFQKHKFIYSSEIIIHLLFDVEAWINFLKKAIFSILLTEKKII